MGFLASSGAAGPSGVGAGVGASVVMATGEDEADMARERGASNERAERGETRGGGGYGNLRLHLLAAANEVYER